MMHKRKAGDGTRGVVTAGLDDVHEWVRSLPWVVERAPLRAMHDTHVRVFAVDCEPLERRQVWLVTGLLPSLFDRPDVAVVMPKSIARGARERGWAIYSDALLPEGHVLVALGRDSQRQRVDLEELMLAGYCFAFS